MKKRHRSGLRNAGIALASCLVLVTAIGAAILTGGSDLVSARNGSEQTDAPQAVVPRPRSTGPSGLPIPRFVSLKTDRVNVRRGPSTDHQVNWVFARRGLPVEIIAEFEHWRRIRDSEGDEGWVYHSMLAGKRTALVAPWRPGTTLSLRTGPEPDSRRIAEVEAGVVADLLDCNGTWCRINAEGYVGWMQQDLLWGVYPGERL